MPENYQSLVQEDGTENRYFFLSDDVSVVFSVKDEKTSKMGVTGFTEKDMPAFLMACIACLEVFGVSGSSAASAVTYQYIDAKHGKSEMVT